MKVRINGILFEDLSVEEALQIAKGVAQVEPTEKRVYHRRFNTKPRWLDSENEAVIKAVIDDVKVSKLFKELSRHTKGAIAAQYQRVKKSLNK